MQSTNQKGFTMKRALSTLAALLLVGGLFVAGCSGTANASPTGVTFTASATTVHVGQPVTYVGSGVCDTAHCRDQIVAFGPAFSRTGTILCECSTLTLTWGSVGYTQLQYRLTDDRGTNGRSSVDIVTSVIP